MKFSYTQTFAKNADTVLKMFCDPAYHEKLQRALGALDYRQLEHSDDGKRFRIKCTYTVKSDVPLPGFAKKILGETSTVVQTETWDRTARKGEVIIEVKALPGSLRAQTAIADSAGGSTKTFNWEVTVKIPLIGGKLEDLIAGDIRSKIEPEQNAGRDLLKNY
ncbi:MAG: DUF2505 domain-containing protein [Nevskiaceae bacterium]|nr:MAG: DUF2505 domain-containing protein [Nevskiaceae bacterium]